MATFFTAAEDSQREVNHFAYEQEQKEPHDKVSPYLLLLWGGVICWDSSGDRSEDDDSVVDYYHGMRCGASYEVYQPNEEEKQDYKEYWKGK